MMSRKPTNAKRNEQNYDIYFGRGKIGTKLPGNIKYKELLYANCEAYNMTQSRYERDKIAEQIVTTMKKEFHSKFWVMEQEGSSSTTAGGGRSSSSPRRPSSSSSPSSSFLDVDGKSEIGVPLEPEANNEVVNYDNHSDKHEGRRKEQNNNETSSLAKNGAFVPTTTSTRHGSPC